MVSAETASPAGGGGNARDPELGEAVRAALGALSDLAAPSDALRDGRVDRMLRAALQAHEAAPGGHAYRTGLDEVAAAVRTACASLAVTEFEDAYLALRAALDRLPRRGDAGPAGAGTG
ncbi:hypothetical protein GCM10023199_56190 [Actinomycetospora chibensis]